VWREGKGQRVQERKGEKQGGTIEKKEANGHTRTHTNVHIQKRGKIEGEMQRGRTSAKNSKRDNVCVCVCVCVCVRVCVCARVLLYFIEYIYYIYREYINIYII
jgi:hypothetical protein